MSDWPDFEPEEDPLGRPVSIMLGVVIFVAAGFMLGGFAVVVISNIARYT